MSAREILVQDGRLYRMLVYVGLLLLMLQVVRAIDYDSFRDDKEPKMIMRKNNRPLRRILETELSGAYGYRKSYTVQETTEVMLHFSTLLRFEILDIFGSLIFEHYEDFNLNQVEALFRVYDETMHRKYSMFEILPSVLKYQDLRPSSICRYIHLHVKTCLKETAKNCMALRKHDSVKLRQQFVEALNHTYDMYQNGHMHELHPNAHFMDMVMHHLQQDTLMLNDRLVAGFLNNIQYDDYDERVRQAEKQTVRHLLSQKHAPKKDSTRRSLSSFQISRFYTVAPLVRYYLQINWHTFPDPIAHQVHFLAGHVIKHVGSINPNIELLGTVYEGSVLHLRYLFDLVIPSDTVDPDVSSAKDYLLRKVTDLRIVDKFLRIEKYQQSGPEHLFMETMQQLKEIGFARDITTALHVQAQFWHRSVVVENLNDLLLLFNSYENLRTVPDHKRFILIIDRIREHLWNAKNVTIDIICNNPRACLRLGLEIVLKCDLVSVEIKNWILLYFSFVNERGSLMAVVCNGPMENIPSTVATQIASTRSTTLMETIATVKVPKVTTQPSTVSTESEEIVPVITFAPTTTTVPTEPPIVVTTVTTEIPTTTTVATTTTKTTPRPIVTMAKLTTTEQPIIVTTTAEPIVVTTTTPELTTYEQPTTIAHKTHHKIIQPTIVVPTISEETTTESTEAIYSINCTTEETEPTTLATVTTTVPTIAPVIFVEKTSEPISIETTTFTERTTEATQKWSEASSEEVIVTTQQFIPKIVTPLSTEVTESCENEDECSSESVAAVTETTPAPQIISVTSDISVELNLNHNMTVGIVPNRTITAVVSAEISCEGSGNCDAGCVGENCLGSCTGPDCAVGCTGPNCSAECNDEDCGVEEAKDCVGPLCHPPEVECSGENCDQGFSSEECGDGKNCQNDSGACSGDDCSSSQSVECIGDDCRKPPIGDQTNPNSAGFGKTDVVVLCHNRDPHHQRKKERMQKMQEKIVAEISSGSQESSTPYNNTDNTDIVPVAVVNVPPSPFINPTEDQWHAGLIHQAQRPHYPTYTPVKHASAYYANLNTNTNVNRNVNHNWNYIQMRRHEDQNAHEMQEKKKSPHRVQRDFDIYTDM